MTRRMHPKDNGGKDGMHIMVGIAFVIRMANATFAP
eukprot:CAMPEP_0172514018 /NCGR_PEP_ID=MMETSP1066-20121228/257196_1 /TAXON_ID=671091 /ORGANISM="Coscinodiscus wailesii, Strain CCMP2513" /LENGTH=35 /DNA_ID= /DNA_START= /DNA_END= /DNA_ORIENTATION=